jgi:hypothetical protein
MQVRALVAVAAMGVISAIATAGPPVQNESAPGAGYCQALRVADSFLTAWLNRDSDAGLALMSDALLGRAGGRAKERESELRQCMTGLSNPHHQAFEIGGGSRLGADRYAFPVRLLELYLGEASGSAYRDTLEVVQQGSDWQVDRLPRHMDGR